jgi:tRNA pseudouridine38-40 synthase
MRAAAAHLQGEHDFTSFRASLCQALSPVKQLAPIVIEQRGAYWRFDFEANAFLHHMIRNIMGCLIQVGQGLHPPAGCGGAAGARPRRGGAHLRARRAVLSWPRLRRALGPAGSHRRL